MRLVIKVVDAAYFNKVNSDSIIYEIVPRYETDEIVSPSSNFASNSISSHHIDPQGTGLQPPPSWLNSTPCVKPSETLVALHQHLRRKYPLLLLPRFPTAHRQNTPGWGSEGLLLALRRRVERYFIRLLARPEVNNDPSLRDLFNNGTCNSNLTSDRVDDGRGGKLENSTSLWTQLPFGRWFGSSGSSDDTLSLIPDDHIIHYKTINVTFPDELAHQEALNRSVDLRVGALKGLGQTLEATMGAVQRYSEALGRVSKSMHELTAAHVRYLVNDRGYSNSIPIPPSSSSTITTNINGINNSNTAILVSSPPSISGGGGISILRAGTLQDDMRATERRFRELGDRFVDLVNQLRPGLQTIHSTVAASVQEVSLDQLNELSMVRAYINREILSFSQYDSSVGRRKELQAKLNSNMIAPSSMRQDGNTSPPTVMAGVDGGGILPPSSSPSFTNQRKNFPKLNNAYNLALAEESTLKTEYLARAEALQHEMDVYWAQTSREFFTAVTTSVRAGLEVSRLHVDALRAWFPPIEPL